MPARPGGGAGGGGGAAARRSPAAARRSARSPVESQRHAGDVDVRHRLQPVHVARQRAAQRDELRTVEPLQLGVGDLQRRQRAADVAGELQLLAREQQHLLDLGQRPFVARRRKLAVQRLERRLLRLRFAEAVFEQRDLGLRVAQVLLGVLDDARASPAGRRRRRRAACASSMRSSRCPLRASSQRGRDRDSDQPARRIQRPARRPRRRGRSGWDVGAAARRKRGGRPPVRACVVKASARRQSIVAGRPIAPAPGWPEAPRSTRMRLRRPPSDRPRPPPFRSMLILALIVCRCRRRADRLRVRDCAGAPADPAAHGRPAPTRDRCESARRDAVSAADAERIGAEKARIMRSREGEAARAAAGAGRRRCDPLSGRRVRAKTRARLFASSPMRAATPRATDSS